MCFIFSDNTKRLIAQKDITCYKIVYRRKERLKDTYISRYQNHTYRIRKIQEQINLIPLQIKRTIFPSNTEVQMTEINEGYHSYKKQSNLSLWITFAYPNFCLCEAKFIIPKGTVYYENDTEYVSERIKMVEILK